MAMEEMAINQALTDMEKNPAMKTSPAPVKDNTNCVRMVPFREKHIAYLKEHPKVIAETYLANLRTMIKIRP